MDENEFLKCQKDTFNQRTVNHQFAGQNTSLPSQIKNVYINILAHTHAHTHTHTLLSSEAD